MSSLAGELATRPRRTRNWARWLVPDLALCLALVTLFYCVFLFNAPRKLFRDADAGWHIRTGETILSTRSLPALDPYSFTRAGQPWFAWEWGADVLMGVANTSAGLAGVVWLYVAAIAAVTWIWLRLNWAAGGNFFVACAFAAPMLSTVNLHWLARPHVFSWLLLLGFVLYFETPRIRFLPAHGVVLTAGGALWANLHASFFLLPLLALLYAAGHLIRPLVWNLDAEVERGRAQWYGWAALAAFAGTLLNPYGLPLFAHVASYLAESELLDRVGEFQSFNFHVDGAGQILLMLGLAAMGGVLALLQKNVTHFLMTVLFLAAALRSARGLPIAALVLLPLANGALTDALRRVRELRPPLRRALRDFLQYSDRLRLLDARCCGLMWAPVALLLILGWLNVPLVAAQTGFAAEDFPVYAAGELPLLTGDVRLLAPDKYGGYLIYRFAGKLKVFFDGRSDFYGAAFMKDYIRLMEVRPGWQEQLERFQFTHALLPVDAPLVPALEQSGWKKLYRDETAVLFERPRPQL